MSPTTSLLGQREHLLIQLGPVLLTLAGIVVAGVLVVWWLRRVYRPDQDLHGGSDSLESLRALHRSGELSDEEFQRARSALLGQLDWTRQAEDATGKRHIPGDEDVK